MKREIDDVKRLIAVHGQLLQAARQRVAQLASAIASCDAQWDREIAKIDQLGATSLFNTVAASRRLRELRQLREQLAQEVEMAEREMARLKRILEQLGERSAGLALAAEDRERDEKMEDWAGRTAAS